MHVGVRPNTGIAKQIPCAAHIGALFHNCVAFVRALHGEMRRSANTGQTGTHNQNIYSRLSLRHMPLHFTPKSY